MSTSRIDPIDVYVGQRIKTARLAAGVSQEALAKMIGKTFQQLQKQERGVNRVSAARLIAIARALGCPVAYFFQGIENNSQPMSALDDPVRLLGQTRDGIRLARAMTRINSHRFIDGLVLMAEAYADLDDQRSNAA